MRILLKHGVRGKWRVETEKPGTIAVGKQIYMKAQSTHPIYYLD
jgi:hypothetical protein